MKKIVLTLTAAVAAFALCFCLAGCSDGASSDPNAGKYVGTTATIIGQETPMKEVFSSGDNYIEIKGGEKCVFCLDGSKIDGTYKLDGKNITINVKDSSTSLDCPGTLENGKLTVEFMGVPLHFEKEAK